MNDSPEYSIRMMLSKIESGKNHGRDSNGGELLHDIKALSKALYMDQTPSKALISSSQARSQSVGKTRLSESKSKIFEEDFLQKDKKSSTWNWKKSIKALTHIRDRKFNCCFFLHVHSIEGLPSNFNDYSLCVHWKRKDEVLHTCPSHICQGVAEFEETLMHRCSVYGHRSGTHNSAKYEARHFLLYASVVGKPGLDMGKHWVDLTKLLPVTLDELEEDKSSGKWSTSYKLSGMAKGATLNVSYGFLIMKDNSIESNNVIFPELLNLNQNRTSTGNDMLQQVGSIPSHGSRCPSLSLDVKILNEGFPNPGLELSRSISFIYKKLDEGKLGNSLGSDIFSEDVESFKPKPNLFFESAEEIIGSDCDDAEFDVTEKGIEFSTKELLKLEDGAAQPYGGSKVETVHVDEIIKDEETDCDLKNDFYGKCKDGDVMDDDNFKENSAYTKDSSMEELEYFLDSLSISDSAELHSPLAMSDFLEQENYLEVKSKFKASKAVKKSLSLDDATESVASEFLKMLGIEDSSFGLSADSDLESPRECLLRQFEKDNLASGNFIFDSEETEVQTQFGCDAPTGSDSGNFGTPTGSEFGNCCKDLHFISVIQAAEEEHKTMGQPLVSRRKAKMLEDLETVALMQEWGLSEKVFQNSPRYSSGGFGSPIYLPPEEPVRLPPLGEGLGPFIQTKDGGFLRSMHPSVFRNVKNGGSLIMQASVLVVLPAEMGADIMEILQHLASIGIEKFSMQASKLMPLEDITGKTMHQIACEAAFALEVPERHTSFVHESEVGQDTFGLGNTAEEFSSWQNNDNLNSSSVGGEMVSDYVSLEDLAPSAMDKIEVLSIEGLRIHSGMSDEEAPSCISSKYVEEISDFDGKKTVNLIRTLDFEGAVGLHLLNASDIGSDDNGLMSLSLTLDEWLRLDSGIICDEDQISEHTSKILAAHHAKCMDLVNGRLKRDRKWGKASGRKWGMLQNNFTVALMVQLRDPFRNYEPVGAPVLALIQVERVFFPPKPKIYNMESEPSNSGEVVDQHESVVKGEVDGEIKEKEEDEELISQFKITQVHVAGVNTEPGRKKLWCSASQHQSGFRWLLANGIDKTNKHVLSKSKVIVKASSQVRAQVWPGEILWSISCRFNGTRAKWKELAALNLHIRNPDVIFPSETVRL